MTRHVAIPPRSVPVVSGSRHRSPRSFGRVVGTLALLAGAAGCSLTDTPPATAPAQPIDRPPATPAGVHAVAAVVLGDSLTVQATPAIVAHIPTAVIDAQVGRTIARANLTDEALSRVPELAAHDAAWFVVELGTNDSTFGGHTPDEMTADVTALLDAIGRDRCIAWVLPFATDPRTPMQLADTETFRQIVTTAVESLACHRVLDWGELAGLDPNLLASDGVHLSDVGIQRFADLIAFGIS